MDILEMIQNISLAAAPILIALGLLYIKNSLRRYCGI